MFNHAQVSGWRKFLNQNGEGAEAFVEFRSVYAVNFLALVPRHWFIYLVCLAFPLLIYINLDNKPFADDSGHYFTLWLLGVVYVAYGIGSLVTDLMNKQMFVCMPRQQLVLRKITFGVGCAVSIVFFFLAVNPAYSYWAPQFKYGGLLLIPIGFMLYALVVYTTMRNTFLAGLVSGVVALSTVLLLKFYFHGSGADIARPPAFLFPAFAIVSFMVAAWFWWVLGEPNLRKKMIGSEISSSHFQARDDVLGLFCAFDRPIGSRVQDDHVRDPGSWLLKKLETAISKGRSGIVLNFFYHLRRSKDLLSFALAWLAFLFLAFFFADNTVDSFNPVILCYLVTMLAMFQGGVLFKHHAAPYLPWGRSRTFYDNLINAIFRIVFLLLAFLLLRGMALGLLHYSSDDTLAGYSRDFLDMSWLGYVYCLCLAPLMLFLFHRSRKPSWVLCTLIICWIFGSPRIFEKFSEQPPYLLAIMMVLSWLPFLALCFRRNFKQDVM